MASTDINWTSMTFPVTTTGTSLIYGWPTIAKPAPAPAPVNPLQGPLDEARNSIKDLSAENCKLYGRINELEAQIKDLTTGPESSQAMLFQQIRTQERTLKAQTQQLQALEAALKDAEDRASFWKNRFQSLYKSEEQSRQAVEGPRSFDYPVTANVYTGYKEPDQAARDAFVKALRESNLRAFEAPPAVPRADFKKGIDRTTTDVPAGDVNIITDHLNRCKQATEPLHRGQGSVLEELSGLHITL